MNSRSTTLALFLIALLSLGCQSVPETSTTTDGPEAFKADGIEIANLPSDFPAAQDLAVLFPLQTDYPIPANTITSSGQTLLSRAWLEKVGEAYLETDVADGFLIENTYEEWRVVAVRFAPCGPLGIRPDQDIEALCWPQVRIVWQPVVRDQFIHWGQRPYYADDRAIHALYHVMPGDMGAHSIISQVQAHLGSGAEARTLDNSVREAFVQARDAAITRLVVEIANIRSQSAFGTLDALKSRTELDTNDTASVMGFTDRLAGLLGRLCEPENLFEMTSFSLPEGRRPAHLDHWSFVAFEGKDGEIEPKPIQVIGPDTGRVIGHAGFVEAVGQLSPDPELLEGLDDLENAGDLEATVVFGPEDVDRLSERINDPKQTLVPNTSCASCHRFNAIRFDFHNLSHLEDRDMTIAPRVSKDVEYDLDWLRRALR